MIYSEGKSFLTQIFNTMETMVQVLDQQGFVLEVSQSWLDQTGFSREDVVGKPYWNFLTPISQKFAQNFGFKEVLTKGSSWGVPYELSGKNGIVIRAAVSFVLFQESKESQVNCMAFYGELNFDNMMTADRNVFFNNTADIMAIGQNLFFHRVNPMFSRVTGFSESELCEMHLLEIFHPEDLPLTFRSLARMHTGEPIKYIENRIRCKDGTYRWVSWSATVATSDRLVFSVARDITEERNLVEEIRTSEQNYKKINEDQKHLIEQLDSFGNKLRKLHQLFTGAEIEAEDMFRRHIELGLEIFNFETAVVLERTDTLIKLRALAGKSYDFEVGQVFDLNDRRWSLFFESESPVILEFEPSPGFSFRSVLTAPVQDHAGKFGVICFLSSTLEKSIFPLHDVELVDLIARRMSSFLIHFHHSQLIEQQRAKMIAASKMAALGEMAAGIAHEINNPLTIIHGNASIIEKLIAKKSPSLEAIAKAAIEIASTTMKIASIIKGLKTFAREGKNDPFLVYKISDILNDALNLCRTRFHNHNIELKIQIEPKDLELECQAVQLTQVLVNLLNNAFDAVRTQESKWVEVIVKSQGRAVLFLVSDSGRGIARDIKEKIMQPFFTTKPVGQGTGLGLSISKGIIENHRGKLEVLDNQSHTTFLISLPMRQDKVSGRSKI